MALHLAHDSLVDFASGTKYQASSSSTAIGNTPMVTKLKAPNGTIIQTWETPEDIDITIATVRFRSSVLCLAFTWQLRISVKLQSVKWQDVVGSLCHYIALCCFVWLWLLHNQIKFDFQVVWFVISKQWHRFRVHYTAFMYATTTMSTTTAAMNNCTDRTVVHDGCGWLMVVVVFSC